MKTIKLTDKYTIGEDKVFVIAEIGSNHNQSLELAYETIDAAKEAGADAVKFQSISVDKLYINPSKETIELHKRIDLPEEWHYLLHDYCKKKDILFFSSPTYLESIDILEELNTPIYKLASAQVGTFPQLVEKVASLHKPTILSTGLVNYGDLEKVVQIFEKAKNDKYIILHCNSIYPTPFERVHLPLMDTYKTMFDCIVGFSDHTTDIFASIAAVARGAKVIEKHFAMSRSLPVPDAPFSLEPEELKHMIEGIRATEKMLKPNVRLDIEQEERGFKNAIATRLVLNKDKKAGDSLQKDDFIFRRNKEGINCSELDSILDKKLNTDVKQFSILKKSYIIR
ncbi:N-acetylneuraminate synthase family protein [Bernardetia sp.]|uniref:N-acetylneuraminate synthase family protein n=1 Tax=Bernardetia sp. TaxID=1937974 RepID=UPI0025BAA650|nr:N-acetylneuraminate synthase family protein [Bernardetia sp.]